MALSVAVCTYGRPVSLARLVRSLAASDPAGCDWELVVVDNAPGMPAQAVTEPWGNDFPAPLRLVPEPHLGVSRARNTAVEAARHSVVAFLDDDVEVEPGWLAAVDRAFSDSGVGLVSGPVTPRWPAPPPAWIDTQALASLSCLDLGDATRSAHPHEIIGANFSLRRDLLRGIGGFREDLGRRGAKLLSGEEFDVACRAASAGEHLVYLPGARVTHTIHPKRLTRGWHLRRSYWGGRTAARLSTRESDIPGTRRRSKLRILRLAARRRAGGSLFDEARHLAWRTGLAVEQRLGPRPETRGGGVCRPG